MRNRGVKGLLGALAGVALLAGCGEVNHRYYGGRSWSLTAQEDYYSEQAKDEAAREYSNIGTSSELFETNEQERGTGGAGESPGGGQGNIVPGGPGREPAQANLWQRQDERVPFPPARFDALAARALGTGKPLKKGPKGAWIQGTYGVELGSGLATSMAPSSGSFQPQVPTEGSETAPPGPTGARGENGYIRP